MASFLENPQAYQFNPYVDTLAADALVKVELEKQQQFNQGWNAVQGEFQSVMGLPIAKEETRQYMQSRLNQLKDNISSSTTGDFSDMRLLSQIHGLTGRIANDPIVQNGVQSTARAQEAFNQMKEDQKAGKLAPQNQARFMESYNQWISDGRADTSFDGVYTPHTDYMKKFIELYKEIEPSITQDDVRVNDSTGQIEVLNQREGIDAAKVNSIWNQVMSDPSVQNQLSIDAWYRYRGMDGEAFSKHVKDSYQGNLDNIQKKVEEIQKRAAIDKTLDVREASKAIEALRNTGTELVNQYNQVGKMIEDGDVDNAKTALFTTNLASTITSNFSWSKDKIVDSPLWKAHMDQVKYELDLRQQAETERYHTLSLQLEAQKMLLQAAKGKSKTGSTGEGTITGDIPTSTSELPVDANAGEKGSSTYYDTIKSTEQQFGQASNKLVFNIANTIPGYINPVKLSSDGSYVLNIDPTGKTGYKSMAEANKEFGKLWQDARKGIVNGTANPKVVNAFQEVDPLIRRLTNLRETAKQIEDKYKLGPDIQNKVFSVDTRIFGNKKHLDLGTKDLLDIYIIKNEPTDSQQRKDAIKRIGSRFKELDFAQVMDLWDSNRLGDFDKAKEYYKTLEKKIKADPTLSGSFSQREEDFKNRQLAFKPLESTIVASKAEEKETIKNLFLGIANSRNINGDSDEFIKMLTQEKGKSTPTDNSYFLDFDRNTGKYYLKVQRGTDVQQMEVSEKDAQNLGFGTTNQFWLKFGDDLSLGQNVKTDVRGAGVNSAYILNQPQGSKYQVKYHLIGDGGGNYDIALYVQNNPGKGEKVKDYTAQQPIMLGQWFSQNQIMEIVNKGIPDTALDALLFGK